MPSNESKLRIMVSRHSAFYSPLIATIAGGFLSEEDITATYSVLPPSGGSHALVQRGEVDVMQSAPGSNWGPMEKGQKDLPVHFALINRRDGFFIAGRKPDPNFEWKSLERASFIADHGGQPMLMLRYAAHVQGVDWSKIVVIDAGDVDEMDAVFRAGRGDYLHQQGPAPQQLEQEGIGHVVASVGAAMPEVAFSSLMATREFLRSERARSFLRAYRKARRWVQESPAGVVAEKEASFFPKISLQALTAAIERYQQLGCWQGGLPITRDLYGQALEVYLHGSAITKRHAFEEVVAAAPE
jgi:NitT/TauT family transport system substrate-binding protein